MISKKIIKATQLITGIENCESSRCSCKTSTGKPVVIDGTCGVVVTSP